MGNHVWLQHYPSSIPTAIDLDSYGSLVDLLEDSFKQYSALPMYENMGKVLSYQKVDELSKTFAAYLQNHTSLQPGDHVAIQLPNLLQYPVTMLGILRAGMVVVNINPLYTSYEMEYQLQNSHAKAIIILANFAHKLAQVLPKTSIQTVIVTEVGDLLGGLKSHIVNFTIKRINKLVPPYHLPHSITLRKALQLGEGVNFTRAAPKGDQAAFLQYTGGTTGIYKGAVLTHRNIIANIEQMRTFMRVKLKEGEEIIITPLPLYHIFSLIVNLLAMIRLGAKNVLITNPRNVQGFIKELRKHRFTIITGVNTLFNSLLAQKEFASLDFSSLKVAVSGGVALQETIAKQWEEVTKTPLVEGYGLTEASPVVSCNMIDGTHRTGTVGIPLPSTIVKIVDDEGNEVDCGEPGSLLVRGPQVMKEYWQQPLETAQVFVDGWLQTGDIAIMDEQGFIKIVDRKKEVINISGFNVYPNEIENVVSLHPKVLEVGVIGIADQDFRETIKAFVVKKDPTLTQEELIAYCKERLTNYKVPKYVEFRDTLPKSNVGKILRRALREENLNQSVQRNS